MVRHGWRSQLEYQSVSESPDRSGRAVSDFRRIQSVWDAIHAGRRVSVLDPSIPGAGCLSILLKNFVLPHATVIAFIVAYGELAIGLGLVAGVLVRTASVCGLVYMLILLFSSNYPGADAPVWQYFGASLDHLVLALCFGAFIMGDAEAVVSLPRYLRRRRGPAIHHV
jgi:hypothetical protein